MTLRVSIIIPTKNRFDKLKSAVDSAVGQTISPTEVLIIDDRSEPQIVEKIHNQYANEPKVHLIPLSVHAGVSNARNIGIEQSRGDYLIFLDDDDTLHPDLLGVYADALNSEDLLICRSELVMEKTNLSQSRAKRYKWLNDHPRDDYDLSESLMAFMALYSPPIHSILIRKKIIGNTRFDPHLTYGEDLKFWLEIAKDAPDSRSISFIGARYHFHSQNASSSTSDLARRRFFQHIVKLNWLSSQSRNVLNLKYALLLLSSKKMKGLFILVRCLSRPMTTIRHLGHFWKYYQAGRQLR